MDDDQARTMGTNIRSAADELPPEHRGTKRIRNALRFGRRLAKKIPGEPGLELARSLAALIVRIVNIRAVPKQMKYDREQFTVRPGQHVEIRFKNPDQIPHNVVFTAPGALQTVGKASVKPGNKRKHDYVPQGKTMKNKILWHTTLINSGGETILRFRAPDAPDEYPYLCTFPGHWRTMNGVMKVRKKNK